MGRLVDGLFALMLGWVRGLAGLIWSMAGKEPPPFLLFLAEHWLPIAAVLVLIGLAMDWMIWMIRWKPYTLWASRMRRRLGIAGEETRETTVHVSKEEAPAAQEAPQEAWLPLQLDEAEAQEAIRRAESMPDEDYGVYPGMRYDAADAPLSETRRFTEAAQSPETEKQETPPAEAAEGAPRRRRRRTE